MLLLEFAVFTYTFCRCTHHFDSVSETKPKEVVFENTKYGTSMWMHMLTKEKDNFSKQIMNNNMEVCVGI